MTEVLLWLTIFTSKQWESITRQRFKLSFYGYQFIYSFKKVCVITFDQLVY